MTKQEVKEEYKQQEGDPQIKGRIRQRMREASQRRMMQNLPQADVVITNPTHYAVAIKYDPEGGGCPIVIAKGEDYLAAKIKEIARDHQIEIVENKPLARMLYANVDVGQAVLRSFIRQWRKCWHLYIICRGRYNLRRIYKKDRKEVRHI